ncbi:reverse transcriptase [Lasius niger]|uniref:Reverse transcriptase n=1 Tax=Lasius niger TaxID=67767 RepID=A0A0J7KF96_LASNI|nr:reverse transcriptase [Lasius niger]
MQVGLVTRRGGPRPLWKQRMAVDVIQCNLNRGRRAQDLLMQQALEMKVGLCVIAEPSYIPKTTGWFYSDNNLAAIYHNGDNLGHTCKLVRRGTNFVAARLGNVHILSCYISPNVSIREYEVFLDDLTECIRILPGKILICGDFNAWSRLWGSAFTNRRGELVED